MLKIKLKPFNHKTKKYYRISVMENLSKQHGKSIVELGFYDPFLKNIKINIEMLRIFLKKGAYPTKTVRNLIFKFFLIKRDE